MKKSILFLLILIFCNHTFTNAQCTAIASGFGNNTSTTIYNITGMNSVQVVLNTNNTITLNLMPNFVTANGPDVKAYLVAPGAMTDAMLKVANFATLTKISLGQVSNIGNGMGGTIMASGAKTFTVPVPAGANISNYSKVFFHCDSFNAFWDLGTITAFTPANCALLGLNSLDVSENDFKIYPNPTSNLLTIETGDVADNILNVKIYNTLGSLVSEKNNIVASTINVSELNSGIYFIEIANYENKKAIKRFVKQ
jgi:Secretion system C-terminal sorting domain